MGKHNDYCVILAGGLGKRLWPSSRKNMPKQFLDFFGAGRTLLQQTYDRIARIVPTDHIYISTFEEYVPFVEQQLPEVTTERILAEPVQLSTAPATAWAAYHIILRDPDATIFVTPCDQMILNENLFEKEMRAALDFASSHSVFLALGVKSTQPNTA